MVCDRIFLQTLEFSWLRTDGTTLLSFDTMIHLGLDVNEFMRGFILTTKGDLESKIDYTFRLYDVNGDNQISGQEIKKMADVIRFEIPSSPLDSLRLLLLFLLLFDSRRFCEC